MLKRLILKNLILVDSCEIEFQEGFTVLSGETGAGKTALIEAIGLCLGKRADLSSIRTGAQKAVVEASFEIEKTPHLLALLEEGGVEFDGSELLIIRREITKEGKNRSFINCQSASLPFIQKIGKELVDLIGQHSHQQLKESSFHRTVLDLFGNLEPLLTSFQESFEASKAAQKACDELEAQGFQRERDIALAAEQFKELDEANLRAGEEAEIVEEYGRLSHFKELTEKGELLAQAISHAPQSLISQLGRLRSTCSSMAQIDPSLKQLLELFQEASISLEEAGRKVSSYVANLELDPKRLAYLEQRMEITHRIQRKYGDNFEEIQKYKVQLQEKLFRLENFEEQLLEAKTRSQELDKQCNARASQLTQKRTQAALKLGKALSQCLQTLNMHGAEVNVEVHPQTLSLSGADSVRFMLKANIGERFLPVEESSSGGELSRLLLSLKMTLADKNNTPTLIFDEIDANVGGETAANIGEKLQMLGQVRQVLSVSHFPQVARKADHHFRVYKEESEGRTTTHIELLGSLEKEKELLRMLGGATV
jgi:DNA repair protein RecN (Recombination protein N)